MALTCFVKRLSWQVAHALLQQAEIWAQGNFIQSTFLTHSVRVGVPLYGWRPDPDEEGVVLVSKLKHGGHTYTTVRQAISAEWKNAPIGQGQLAW